MAEKMDMSLDEIISSSKKPFSGTRPRSNNFNPRRARPSEGRGFQPKYFRGDVNNEWRHDLYDGPKRPSAMPSVNISGGATSKLLLSNLDYGVSETDIKELFSELGPLRNAAVHFDRSGRSRGTADVVFERRSDALKALKQYNGVPLDGRPMNIELATADLPGSSLSGGHISGAAPWQRQQRVRGELPYRRNLPKEAPVRQRTGLNNSNRKSRSIAGGGNKATSLTAEELDAELDAYVSKMK